MGRPDKGRRRGLPGRSVIGQGARRPAGQRTVAEIVRRLVEHRLPSSSWQGLQVTRTWPMPRPRSAASRAGAQIQGVQLTVHLPGQS